MNLDWSIVSLFLASVTGWALAAYGSLPVAVLRTRGGQVLAGAAGWIVVALLAPSQIFHWYLIFTILGLVAWTKLNRPAGKIWLAFSAALGLTLGVIFPLEITPPLYARENAFLLALLYLDGARTGFACVTWATCARPSTDDSRPHVLAKALVIFSIAGLGLTVWRWRLGLRTDSFPALVAPCLLSGVLAVLAAAALLALRRNSLPKARLFSGAAAVLSLADGLMTQLVFS